MKHIICILMALLLLPAAIAEEARYDELGFYGEDAMWPVQRDGKWGFIDYTGTLIIPCEWETVGMVVDGRAPVQKDGKWGVIDQNGQLLIPCEWDSLIGDSYGGLIVHKNGFCGALALDGTVLIPCDQYTYVGPAINGVRHIGKGDAWGMCSTSGEIITDCQWQNLGYFHDGLAYVSDLSGISYGYINGQGELVIPCVFASADDFRNGSAVVRTDEGWQLIDASGHFLCDEPWDKMEQFCQGDLIMVEKDGKFGYINRQGEIAIPVIYDNAQEFGDGLALVKLGDDTFWINETGEKTLDRLEGYTSSPFCSGLAAVTNVEGCTGLMDKQGNFITPCQWDRGLHNAVSTFRTSQIIIVWQEEHCAFLNRQGEMISERMYKQGTFQYGVGSDALFILEDGTLSVWNSDGMRVH